MKEGKEGEIHEGRGSGWEGNERRKKGSQERRDQWKEMRGGRRKREKWPERRRQGIRDERNENKDGRRTRGRRARV